MRRPYYYAEHESAYEEIARRRLAQWNDQFHPAPYEQFQNRPFLESALATLRVQPGASVLEYGCGTGPAACYLAAAGLRVDAFDLVPRAIELARTFAAERELDINFYVADICDLADAGPAGRYDLVVDSYCLQSVVTDDDRRRLFAAVRDRIKPSGRYLISTAMYEPTRTYDEPFRYDESTGICYHSGQPYRRHRPPEALRDELTANGFVVVSQTGEYGGDVVCGRN